MVKLTFHISPEAYELLVNIGKTGGAEYRDTEYLTLKDFKERGVSSELEYRTEEWFLKRNFGGTYYLITELIKYGLVDMDYDAWHQTYILTDFGEEILGKNI